MRIAEEDITVYKIIEKRMIYTMDEFGRGRFSYEYFTPYIREKVSIGAGRVLKPDVPMSKERAEWLIGEGYRCFGAGLIHAYIDRDFLRWAWISLCQAGLIPMHSLVEVECVIPKGEFYILGEKGDVAASKLIVKKIVDKSKEK